MDQVESIEDWEREPQNEVEKDFVVHLNSYEGPLDVLLDLARKQKIDLKYISIIDLVDQYVAYTEQARSLKIDLSAEYLLMASWLTLLKSRLLLPKEQGEQDTDGAVKQAEEFLQKLNLLESVRELSLHLEQRLRLGRDWNEWGGYKRETAAEVDSTLSLHELVEAYARVSPQRKEFLVQKIKSYDLYSVSQALSRLRSMMQDPNRFYDLEEAFDADDTGLQGLSQRGSAFTAALQLEKERYLDSEQEYPFGPINLKLAGDA